MYTRYINSPSKTPVCIQSLTHTYIRTYPFIQTNNFSWSPVCTCTYILLNRYRPYTYETYVCTHVCTLERRVRAYRTTVHRCKRLDVPIRDTHSDTCTDVTRVSTLVQTPMLDTYVVHDRTSTCATLHSAERSLTPDCPNVKGFRVAGHCLDRTLTNDRPPLTSTTKHWTPTRHYCRPTTYVRESVGHTVVGRETRRT